MVIFPQTPRWILKFLLILMSTYYNKSNCNVKVSSEQTLIEMSISNGVKSFIKIPLDMFYKWLHLEKGNVSEFEIQEDSFLLFLT